MTGNTIGGSRARYNATTWGRATGLDGSAKLRPPLARKVLGVMKRLGLRRSIPEHTHSHGMVGLVKELVDEQGAGDLA